MLARFVGHRRHDDDPAPVGGIDGLLGLPWVADRTQGLLDHVGALVETEEHAGGEPAPIGDERVAHPDGQELAAGTGPDVAGAVLGGGGIERFARPVPVADRVEGVVVAVQEVPARDVVDVAVPVVVDAVVVRRVEDQVLGIGEAVAVAIGDRLRSR